MKFNSSLMSAASGSAGGLVASHNRGGQYFRKRVVPTNPGTPQQALVRSILANLTARWSNTLTGTQRAAWILYANNTPLPDTLGEPRVPTGLNMYCKVNVPRVQAGKSLIDAGPVIFGLTPLSTPTVTSASAAGQSMVLAYNNADQWAIAVGGHLFVYISRPQSVGIVFFKGPYRLATAINGAVIPPASPATITTPFVIAAGQRLYTRVVAITADGRPSAEFFGGVTVGA